MSHTITRESIRYVAVIDQVREVILVGTADLASWRDRLSQERLHPYAPGGQAELAISATAARWYGVRFCEFSVSVSVSARADGATHDGYYLVHAYNSVRAFAWAERAFFKTPYYPGQITVEAREPARLALREAGQPTFSAAMAGARAPAGHSDMLWAGPIWLPSRHPGAPAPLFYARLAGDTAIYPFEASSDTLDIKPADRAPIFEQLLQSGFAPYEWRVRAAAHHAKSKTYWDVRLS